MMNGFIIAAVAPQQLQARRSPDPAFLARQVARRDSARAQQQERAEALAALRAEAVANAALIRDAHAAAATQQDRDDKPRWTPTAQWTPPPDMRRW